LVVIDSGSRCPNTRCTYSGPVHTMSANALQSENGSARGAKAKAGGIPASFCNKVQSHFRSNPKGTGVLGRHSALHSSLRRAVLASSSALIGAPCHPFALADIVRTGPSSADRG